MNRITPRGIFDRFPCTITATATALINIKELPAVTALEEVSDKVNWDAYDENGYLSLKDSNKLVRSVLKIKRRGYRYFKRVERFKLKDWSKLFPEGKFIVMVYGHCIFVDGNDYYSFFENNNDNVVACWQIEE